MPARRESLSAIAITLLTAAAPAAFAQSSPYFGSWSGLRYLTTVATCSCSGGGCSGSIPTQTCVISTPWMGTIDAQGNLTESTGAGTFNCDPGNTSSPIAAAGPNLVGQIPANGTLSTPIPATNSPGLTESCSNFVFQFTSSAANSSYSCTYTSTSTDAGSTTTCHGTIQEMTMGGKNPGGGVLVPPTPVFPITVNSNITATTASATAQISPPSQLAGTAGSVYVFAHARLSTLTHTTSKRAAQALPRDGTSPDPCVLAQLNSSGQLTAASASSMQPYLSGVLSAQGQSVTILNNASTANVAGATFLVGYGASSSSMISGGTYEGAVSVNGASSCSAALLAGAAPNAPSALSGLWWNANESGWGISFTQRRNVVFGAWYTYDAAGKPKWYVASSCALPSGVTGTSGTCTGTLYQVTGPTYFGVTFNPSLDSVQSVGNLQITFQDANTGTMNYTIGGQSRTVPITRQLFQSGTVPPAIDYTDLWWNPNESGWGMTVTQQYGVMFLAWYVYDGSGNPVWYVAPDCVVQGSACSGSVYSTTGPPLGPAFDPHAVTASSVGTITLQFLDANNASVSYTVSGVSGTKAITRQTF